MTTARQFVMVIDDNKINNFICEKIIEEYSPSISVKSYVKSEEGLACLLEQKESIHLLFLDLSMPVYDGWDILKIMTEEKISIPTIILTSSINEDDKRLAEGFSFVIDYLVKPATYDLLTELLSRHLKVTL